MRQNFENSRALEELHAAARASVSDALRAAARHKNRDHLRAARAMQRRFWSIPFDAHHLERIRGEADWLVLAVQLDA